MYVDGRRMLANAIISPPAGSVADAAKGGNDEQLAARREAKAAVGEMLERIDPSDIELVEIDRGPGQLPAEFHEDNCGAIAIWTRWAGR